MTSTEGTRIITIVGGGFTGRTVAVQQAWHYAALAGQGQALPPLHIRLVDARPGAGGVAYGTEEDVFLVNQPASCMSPFPGDKGHFTRWLGGDGSEFATRRRYGEYLEETFRCVFNEVAGVTVEIVRDNAAALWLRDGPVAILTQAGRTLNSDVLVLATGHGRGEFLRHLERETHYFSFPYTTAGIREALAGNDNGAAVIVGTGQSMMDALAALDHAGHRGKIYAISRHGVEPWAYHPGHYGDDRPPYAPHFLDPIEVRACSGSELAERLEKEIDRARRQGYDVGHVLAAVDFAGLATAGSSDAALGELRALWAKYYGNPTAPERKKLYDDYKARGQLQVIRGEIRAENIKPSPRGFVISGLLPEDIDAALLFNGAPFTHDPLASPLLRQAEKLGALRHAFNSAAIAPGHQSHPRLFVAGPAVSPDKWGVETFRDNNAVVAKFSVERALEPYPAPQPQKKGRPHVR